MQYSDQQNNSEELYPQPQLLDRNQKLAVVFLFIFTLSIIGYGAYQFRNTLVGAIDYSGGDPKKIADAEEIASTTDAYLRAQDTDKDGLNDWEEKNIYSTSAFLDDTDGDSVKDGEEIKRGTDPRCMEGKDCSQSNFLSDAFASSSQTAAGQSGTSFSDIQLQQMQQVSELVALQNQINTIGTTSPVDGNTVTTATSGDLEAQKILKGGADISTLRSALLKSGMKQSDLDKISDEALMKNYNSILSQQ